MARYDELPVFKATYDMMLSVFQFVKDFSKEYKYTVGDAMRKEAMELMTLIYRANSRLDRSAVLAEARERLEILRLYIRLMRDLQQVSTRKFVRISEQVEMVSRQLTGWQKASLAK